MVGDPLSGWVSRTADAGKWELRYLTTACPNGFRRDLQNF